MCSVLSYIILRGASKLIGSGDGQWCKTGLELDDPDALLRVGYIQNNVKISTKFTTVCHTTEKENVTQTQLSVCLHLAQTNVALHNSHFMKMTCFCSHDCSEVSIETLLIILEDAVRDSVELQITFSVAEVMKHQKYKKNASHNFAEFNMKPSNVFFV